MSLVGPRPKLQESFNCLRGLPDYTQRFSVRPGLTGWAQICGRALNQNAQEKNLQRDLEYIAQQSLWLDSFILLRTLLVIFSKSGT